MTRWFLRFVTRESREQSRRTLICHLFAHMERHIMAKLDDLSQALDDIKQGLADHGTKLAEIGGDIDDLIALAQSGGDLQPLIDKANDIKAAVVAEGDALNTLAAKHDTPAPEPTDQPPTP